MRGLYKKGIAIMGTDKTVKKNRRRYEGLTSIPGYFVLSRPEMLGFVPQEAKKVLEIGCGEGNFGRSVKVRNQAIVWGVEMDRGAARAAALKLDKILRGGIQSQLERLPRNYFDCVIFNDVLEHLPDPEKVLEEIRKNIIPGGWIICSIPNVFYISNLKGLMLDRDWKYTDFGILDRSHLRFFTRKSIRRMFEDLGYTVQGITGINGCRWKIFFLFNAITLGLFHESKYLQYACVVRTPQP
jgi:2-polyprenyl-3-methyl-5-hydroxy-6-metoxy-1,4-benzoquinol methylase